MKRVLTAVVLIPPVAYLVLAGNPTAVAVVVALVALLCFHEYRHLMTAYGYRTAGPFGYAAGIVLLVVTRAELLVVTLVLLLTLVLSLRGRVLDRMLPEAALLFAGIVYIFGSWRCAIGLREISPHWLLFALVLNWVGDSAAYYGGRALGRHKLAPRISPKKTWEGAAFAVAAAVVFGVVYLHFFLPLVPVWKVIALAALANIAGQIGDLAESAMKRGAGVKDSGSLLPGHGGWLDRMDSTLFAMPVIYFWLLAPWNG